MPIFTILSCLSLMIEMMSSGCIRKFHKKLNISYLTDFFVVKVCESEVLNIYYQIMKIFLQKQCGLLRYRKIRNKSRSELEAAPDYKPHQIAKCIQYKPLSIRSRIGNLTLIEFNNISK